MITDLKLIKELRNYIIKWFIKRKKDIQSYGSLYIAISNIQENIEEELIEIGQKLIDSGFNKDIYIKEQKKWLVPVATSDKVIKIMIEDKNSYKKLVENPIDVNNKTELINYCQTCEIINCETECPYEYGR